MKKLFLVLMVFGLLTQTAFADDVVQMTTDEANNIFANGGQINIPDGQTLIIQSSGFQIPQQGYSPQPGPVIQMSNDHPIFATSAPLALSQPAVNSPVANLNLPAEINIPSRASLQDLGTSITASSSAQIFQASQMDQLINMGGISEASHVYANSDGSIVLK